MALTLPDGGIKNTNMGKGRSPAPIPTTPTPVQQQQQPNGYQNLTNFFQTMLPTAMPGIAAADASINNSIGQVGQLAAYGDMQSGLINQQLQTQLSRLGIQQQGQGLDQDILNRQLGLLPKQDALQQQLYGMNNQAINENISNTKATHGLNLADIVAQRNDLFRSYENTKQNLTGQAAAQGAINTSGYNRQQGDLATQLQNSLEGLARSGQREDIGYNSDINSLNRSLQQQDINKQQYGLNYAEQQAQLADKQKNLDLVAKSNNLDKDELENRTQQALAQLGLSQAVSTSQIYESIINAQKGKFDALTPILGYLYQYIGVRPSGS